MLFYVNKTEELLKKSAKLCQNLFQKEGEFLSDDIV